MGRGVRYFEVFGIYIFSSLIMLVCFAKILTVVRHHHLAIGIQTEASAVVGPQSVNHG